MVRDLADMYSNVFQKSKIVRFCIDLPAHSMLFLCPEGTIPESDVLEEVKETGSKRKRENKSKKFFAESDKVVNVLYSLARESSDFPECLKSTINSEIVELSCLLEYGKMSDMALSFGGTEEEEREIVEVTDLPCDIWLLFNQLLENRAKTSISKEYENITNITIPPFSRFLMSDLSRVRDLTRFGSFDLILMDPPWPNKSVERSGKYDTIDIYDLFKIPMKKLATSGGLFCLWVTNSPRILNFVKTKLFPDWGLVIVAEWWWMKVDERGDWVFPIVDESSRRPYERLIIGKFGEAHGGDIPASAGIISRPEVHSVKPYLGDIMASYLAKEPKRLEVFAREVREGWTSWGNECLRFNGNSKKII